MVSKRRLNSGISSRRFVCSAHGFISGKIKLIHSIRSGTGICCFIIYYWRISHDSSRSGFRATAYNCVVKYASYFLLFSQVKIMSRGGGRITISLDF